MSEGCWYACVFETDKRIIYGRAPVCDADSVVDSIKHSLCYHNLIGLNSRVFLRPSRFLRDDAMEYCERQMERKAGEFGGFQLTKLDLRWEQ